MKNVLFALALCTAVCGSAQVLNVGTIDKVNIPANADAKVAAISPQGNYLLLTTGSNQGLTRFDLGTSQSTVISKAPGAGYDVQISQDGQDIVYREKSQNAQHLSFTALKAVNLASNATATLVQPTRDLQGVAIEGATAVAVNKGKLAKRALGAGKAVASAPVLSIQNRHLMITRGGKTRTFDPSGKQLSYLWPSLSPDGSKVLYYVAGMGTCVCNIDGTGARLVGKFRAPVWYDNNTVLGMNDQDDGEFIYASTIVAASLDGATQTLTDGNIVAMYPKASAQSGKIAFSTPAGEAYIINIVK